MKMLMLTLLVTLNSFAFFQDLVDPSTVRSEQFLVECQDSQRLYHVNVGKLISKKIKNFELVKLEFRIREARPWSDESCSALSQFNIKAKQLLEE